MLYTSYSDVKYNLLPDMVQSAHLHVTKNHGDSLTIRRRQGNFYQMLSSISTMTPTPLLKALFNYSQLKCCFLLFKRTLVKGTLHCNIWQAAKKWEGGDKITTQAVDPVRRKEGGGSLTPPSAHTCLLVEETLILALNFATTSTWLLNKG